MEESLWGSNRCGFIASSKEYLGYAETVIIRIAIQWDSSDFTRM